MTTRLVSPADAAGIVGRRITQHWPDAVCAELDGREPWRTSVPLSPGVTSRTQLAHLGFAAVHEWVQAWDTVTSAGDVELVRRRISVERVAQDVPATLVITGLDAASAFLRVVGDWTHAVDVPRARSVGRRLRDTGARCTPATLAAVNALADPDVDVTIEAVMWLADHPDLDGWTARQLPVPGMHSKWLAAHGALLHNLVGKDVRAQVRPRLAVVHLTYVDPEYRAGGGRRHDAWTSGDTHQLAYPPRTVLIVENRDSRLWFPPMDATVVVEGGGKAASALLGGIDWLRRATTIAYWGDIDADGFAILDHLRATLSEVPLNLESILMDGRALNRYKHLGVNFGADGRPLGPATAQLPNLTTGEREAYHAVATAGPATVRRVEQERIAATHAAEALAALTR